MIRLKVEDYCQECPYFDPISIYGLERTGYQRIVKCRNTGECERVAEWVKNKMMSEMIKDCPGGVHE